jgi:hypothetical protein
MSPMSWNIGSQLTMTDSGVCSNCTRISSSLCRMFACVTITPLATPVEPDVYCRRASEPPSISGRVHPASDPAIASSVPTTARRGAASSRRLTVLTRPPGVRDEGGPRVGHDRLEAGPRAAHSGRRRYRGGSCVQAPEERRDEVQSRRVHEQDPLAGGTPTLELRAHAARASREVAERHPGGLGVAVLEEGEGRVLLPGTVRGAPGDRPASSTPARRTASEERSSSLLRQEDARPCAVAAPAWNWREGSWERGAEHTPRSRTVSRTN